MPIAIDYTTVGMPCAAYTRQSEHWHLPRTLLGGTSAMRKAGEKYLPMESAESESAYKSRLARTTLFNAFSKAVRSLNGKIFEKGVILTGASPDMVELMECVDESGRDLERFLHDVADDAMAMGHTHILVDFPVNPDPERMTKEKEKQLGLRPWWVHVKVEDLFWWKLDSRGKLDEIRMYDTKDGKKAIRIITKTEWAVVVESSAANAPWELHSQGTNSLGVVPLVSLYTRRTAELESKPPLDDLAHKNVEHWQSSSDQRNILHVARVPILFGSGFNTQESLVIGANQLITGPTGSTLAYVEHSGKAIQAGADDLKKIEEQMAILSMEPVLQTRSGNQTATARALDTAEAQSSLSLVATDFEDSVELAMTLTAMWLGVPESACGSVSIECDFTLAHQDSASLQELGKARTNNDISRSAYVAELKRRGILAGAYDPDADMVVILKEIAAAEALALGVDPDTDDAGNTE